MFFWLSKIAWFLANPATLVMIAILVGTVLVFTRWWRAGRMVLAGLSLAVLFMATIPLGTWMFAVLEERFPIVENLPGKVDGIVVLGGVIDQFTTRARRQMTINDSVERLTAFADLALRYPKARLFFTGGSGSLLNQDLKEADYVAPLLRQLGLDPSRVVFEDQSRNTVENARLTRPLANPLPGETWILITSAFHMPRSVGCFRKAGWTVLPYPVDFHTRGDEGWNLQFSFGKGMGSLGIGLREWIGLAAYWATGKTDTLFPGPAP
jgi:uncharacterized SAM-binding protein YcdF (DUF218 family)